MSKENNAGCTASTSSSGLSPTANPQANSPIDSFARINEESANVSPPDSSAPNNFVPPAVSSVISCIGGQFRRVLLDSLNSLRGPKLLLLDESLAYGVSSLVDACVLQQNGVERCFALGAFPLPHSALPAATASAPNILFLCRPRVTRLSIIVRHIKYMEDNYPPASVVFKNAMSGSYDGKSISSNSTRRRETIESNVHGSENNIATSYDAENVWVLKYPPKSSFSSRYYFILFVPNSSNFLLMELRRLLSASAAADERTEESPTSLATGASALISNLGTSMLSSSKAKGEGENRFSLECVSIMNCPLFFFPIDKDILSLEDANAFKAFHVDGDVSVCQEIATALIVYQNDVQAGELIPHLRCIGSAARCVAEHLIRHCREMQRRRKVEPPASDVTGTLIRAVDVSSALVPPVHFILGPEDFENGEAEMLEEFGLTSAWDSEERNGGKSRRGEPLGARMLPEYIVGKQADMMILIDRRSDVITPLCTPFTYEGLLDCTLGIDGNGVDVPVQLLQQSNAPSESVGFDTTNSVGCQMPFCAATTMDMENRQRVSLVSDQLYVTLRDLHQGDVGSRLHRIASDIQQTYKSKEGLKTIADISSFMPKFKAKQQEHTSLSVHVKLASFISTVAKDSNYHRRLCIEDKLLQTGGGSGGSLTRNTLAEFEDLIDESAALATAAASGSYSAASATLEDVYRLLCLASVIHGGLKQKQLEPLQNLLIQQHGIHELRRLKALSKVGLLRTQQAGTTRDTGSDGLGIQRWQQLKSDCRLLVDETDAVKDIAYVCSGYAPLSVRLIQMLHWNSQGWRSIPHVLNLLWGPAMEIRQQQPQRDTPHELRNMQNARHIGCGRNNEGTGYREEPVELIMVVYLGGITYAEIAAIRRLNFIEHQNHRLRREPQDRGQTQHQQQHNQEEQQTYHPRVQRMRQYLIVTTEILNHRKLIKSMMD